MIGCEDAQLSTHLDILDLKALDVQVIQPQQSNGITDLKACVWLCTDKCVYNEGQHS